MAAFEVRALIFPRERFTTAEAMAWGSLHGFDHGRAKLRRGFVVLPQEESASTTRGDRQITVDARDGIFAVVGPRGRPRRPLYDRHYEAYSARLRKRALSGRSSIHKNAPVRGNDDLVAWYAEWFPSSHPRASRREIRVAHAIMHGIRQASREHALEYVRKLGYGK